MEFRIACIAGVSYAEVIDENKLDDQPGLYATFKELREILGNEVNRNPFEDPHGGMNSEQVSRPFYAILRLVGS